MGPSSLKGSDKMVLNLLVKHAELTFIPPMELLEEETLIGSSNWEDHPGKIAFGNCEMLPPLKPAIKCSLLNTASFAILSVSPQTSSITLISMQNPNDL